jgi:Tfp pilus assembly protein PilZ
MDVSHEGMFIESNTVFREGVTLHLAIETQDRNMVLVDGEVRWSKKYATRYSHKLKSGMGILIKKFDQGKDVFESFCPREVCIDCTALPDE